MEKFFTRIATLVVFTLIAAQSNAQQIWPTADTVTIRASQFADASTIKVVKKDTATAASLATFKNWITMGKWSDNPAKADSAVWMWGASGQAGLGAYSGKAAAVVIATSDTSRGRGLAFFDSDFLDNRGVAGNFANGPSASPHRGELWSPIIDATGYKNMVLSFNASYRHFTSSDSIPCNASTAVAYSTDGGVTWTSDICIFEMDARGTNEGAFNGPLSVKLPASVGSNKFRFKFIFDGDYYYWSIDDVKLGAPKFDLRIMPDWTAIPTVAVHTGNTDSLRFLADVFNAGSVNATNVKLTAEVLNNATGAVLYTTSRNYGTLKADSLAENELLPGAYKPIGRGVYVVRYTLTSDSSTTVTATNKDFTPFDNSSLWAYNVIDSLFQNDRDAGTALYKAGWVPTIAPATKAWRLGNYYFMPKGTAARATRISAYVGENNLASITAPRTYTAELYEWTDTNNNDSVEVAERKLIGAGEAILPAAAASSLLNFRLENAIGVGDIVLKDNQAYLAMFVINPSAPNVNWFGGFDDRRRFQYGAMQLATKKAGKPRYTGVIDINSADPNAKWGTDVFGSEELDRFTPKVRLWAWQIRIGVKDDLPADVKMSVYPNPAKDDLNVSVEFPSTQEAFVINIFDLTGKQLMQKEIMNAQKENVVMDVRNLPNGTYMIQVQDAAQKVRTMRFVKAN